jgi:glyoxylase-like metal-dependent hydrolase (beta-lactamase superfamily II)
LDVRVISIGVLPAHPLWDERGPVRAGHATCTLVRPPGGKRVILVDPGLPEPVIASRLRERAGIGPDAVTHVFLTSFRPDTSRGINAFPKATWWVSQAEREGTGVPLVGRLKEAAENGDEELRQALELDVAILKKCEPAPDNLAPGVDLFPLPGVTPGMTGLLVAAPKSTTVICGDAVPTLEHLDRRMVLPNVYNLEQAQESFAEALEIADVLVLGRDNLVMSPGRR